jgi:hypothetical protein
MTNISDGSAVHDNILSGSPLPTSIIKTCHSKCIDYSDNTIFLSDIDAVEHR